MNVVGRVGSIFTSVATPFHPFGGAVDIIVVKQQDGTFRSTPWYVRFGKFQGVLKGVEKIVRIEVNGVEANFHMYLDNSGGAYFVRDVVSGKDIEESGGLKDSDALERIVEDSSLDYNDNEDSREENADLCGQESRVSDTGVVQLQDENVSLGVSRMERSESKYYEFQDEEFSPEGSVELSEYGSSRYENLDSVEHIIETEDPNSAVILVSVDGHILTAPISSSEENTASVQLNTSQFHLGHGKTKFNTDARAAGYLNDLDTCAPAIASGNVCDMNDNSNSENQLRVCEGDEEHACQVQDTQITTNEEREPCVNGNLENMSASIKKVDFFQSCLELAELAMQVENESQRGVVSPTKIYEVAEDSKGKSPLEPEIVDLGEAGNIGGLFSFNSDFPSSMPSPDLLVEVEPLENNALSTDPNSSDCIPGHSERNDKETEEEIDAALAAKEVESGQQGSASEEDCRKGTKLEPQTTTSGENMKPDSSTSLELSLCGNLLHAGMGVSAASEAFDAHRISEEQYRLSAVSLIKNENLVIKFQGKYLSWDKAAPIVLGLAAYGLDLPVEPKDVIPVDQDETPKFRDDDSSIASTPSGRRWSRLWSIPFRRVKTLEHTSSNSSEEFFVDSESGIQNQTVEPSPKSQGSSEYPHKQLIRTNVPTTEQITSLNLKEGQNMVTFSCSTKYVGMQKVEAHIYLWKWDARIVISDVDGTITKSDVLGQFMPLLGKDWTHSGIARLFSAIKENGYQLLFLSARAIVQAYLTRSFLNNLRQDGTALPIGPVVISPDGLFPSLFREVIRRAPHEFKIACLEDIKALFPPDYNPFYAGFGNRDTDELSYRKIGIPKGKIFIINPKGEVAISHRIDMKSYTSLHTLVNDMFPPTSLVEQEDYNSWNYWKMPMLDIDL